MLDLLENRGLKTVHCWAPVSPIHSLASSPISSPGLSSHRPGAFGRDANGANGAFGRDSNGANGPYYERNKKLRPVEDIASSLEAIASTRNKVRYEA